VNKDRGECEDEDEGEVSRLEDTDYVLCKLHYAFDVSEDLEKMGLDSCRYSDRLQVLILRDGQGGIGNDIDDLDRLQVLILRDGQGGIGNDIDDLRCCGLLCHMKVGNLDVDKSEYLGCAGSHEADCVSVQVVLMDVDICT